MSNIMSTTEHNNWLTLGEALRITKLELEPFLQEVVDNWYKKKLLVRLGSNGNCKNPATCKEEKVKKKCGSCKAWCGEMQKLHRINKDMCCWKNADCTKWASGNGAWEVAKVFMSNLGDRKSDVLDSKSTDIQGLLNLLQNLPQEAYPNAKIPDLRNLNTKDVVKTRNNWAHAPEQEITEDNSLNAFRNLLTFADHLKLAGVNSNKMENLKNRIQNLKIDELTMVRMSAIEQLLVNELRNEIAKKESEVKIKNLQGLLSKAVIIIEKLTWELEQPGEIQTPLKSFIPPQQENIFGRDQAINEISDLINTQNKPCIVLTGGPGFGKTTVAIQAAHELESEKVVLFASLRDMHSINDTCGRILRLIGRSPKENEVEELEQWARTLKEKVILVLDNLEDVLQSDHDGLCKLLQNCLTNSCSNLQYLITSRQKIQLPCIEVRFYEITVLNEVEGVNVIRSRMPENHPEYNSEELSKLVSLCEGVPLALRIVGSLLEATDLSNLIEELESDPLQVLADASLPPHHKSISVAIEYSFKHLDDSLKARLVRLSIFRGPFNKEAVSEIWGEKSVLQQILELKQKSLLMVSHTIDVIYELHPFIQKYLQDVSTADEYREDMEIARSKFRNFYVSMIMKGSECFWSYDRFEECIEIFKNDALNIEHALDMYSEKGEIKSDILENVRPISFYLNMCFTFQKLFKFLKSCLQAATKLNKKCSEMDIHCLIVYFEWKNGNEVEAKSKMKDAENLYEEVVSQLVENQKWFYYFTIGFHLDQQRKNHSECNSNILNQAMDKTREAYEILQKQPELKDIPERALILSGLGIIEKHRQNHDEAEKWLKQSLEERTKLLGEDHILTASSKKRLADLYLTKQMNPDALKLYNEVLCTYKKIGMENQKQCINLWKNMASCHKWMENHSEALEFSEKALYAAKQFLPYHKVIFDIHILLSSIEKQHKRWEEAEYWLVSLLDNKNFLDRNHKLTSMLKKELAHLYLTSEKYSEACCCTKKS